MKIVENATLADYTSLGVGGPTKRLLILESDDRLVDVLKQPLEKPIWVLGYGKNCLISDAGLPGTVIINCVGQIRQLTPTRLQADSGVNWDDLVQYAIGQGLWGLEFTSAIPGGVGAAVAGNIAAYGQQIADTLVEAEVLNTDDGTLESWSKDQFDFAYRYSKLTKPENQNYAVLSATFELSEQATAELNYASALKAAEEVGLKPDSLADRRQIILQARRNASALLEQSPRTAGSFFKNPMVTAEQIDSLVAHDESGISREQLLNQNRVHGGSDVRVSAAHVLLAAGFKRGQTWGPVRLHPDHILKVENAGGASARQIYDAVQEIISTVKEKLGITLEPEVRFLGDF